MRINVKVLPEDKLFHLFDLAAKAKNETLATQVVNELANRNHIRVAEQLIKLGQKANDEKKLASFQMVSKLWNRW